MLSMLWAARPSIEAEHHSLHQNLNETPKVRSPVTAVSSVETAISGVDFVAQAKVCLVAQHCAESVGS